MTFLDAFVEKAASFLGGNLLIFLIVGTGILLSCRTRFVQLFHLGKAMKFAIKDDSGNGEVSSFGALCTALSATIGTGNIIGVSTAITAGGPGALFWMLVAAFFGMATKYAEGLLAIRYRTVDEDGHVLGGPFYYIERGIREKLGGNWKWLGKLFALFGAMAGLLGIGTITQVNGVAEAADRLFCGDPLFFIGEKGISLAIILSGVVITIFATLVILGGIHRVAAVSSLIVPFMAIGYVLLTLLILLCNLSALPGAIVLIFKKAFSLEAVAGGTGGVLMKAAIEKGVGRGVFSNEAGLGSAPIAAAAAKTDSCVKQGLVSMLGTFVDTLVICTMTGLSVIVTGAWNETGLEGFAVTAKAWETGLPFLPQKVGLTILTLTLSFFVFTTIIGWNYYSERCVEYLSNRNQTVLRAYRFLYLFAVAIAPYLTVSTVWNLADVCNYLMAFPNLVALMILSGVVSEETKLFFKKKNHDLT